MSQPTNPYRHRLDSPDTQERLAYIKSLVDDLLELERKTTPDHDTETEDDKDLAAFRALETAGILVEEIAGWAIDHQIGLALSALEFVPRQPSGTRNHHGFLHDKATADSHEHEARGSAYFEHDSSTIQRDTRAERRMLANLLQMNPGGFPSELAHRAVEALKALDLGETQSLLQAEKAGLDRNAYSRRQLELRALAHVEYMTAKGMKKYKAQETVGEAYGRSASTVRDWEYRLRKSLGGLEVSRALSFARNSGKNTDAAKKGRGPRPSARSSVMLYESRYGEDALQQNAADYIAAVADSAPEES